ncbi:hypothetical protein BDN70DRAFT_939024 [Pholiota conissans]|uniref:Uncharacterized protein n=1 Tax=Pholiota conissans TaxID=109636 RepID=A0A9P5YPI9_9AGAR|nr:hypothetical protein BDN70DRAFT_939024 [Pholiota conissans]
MPYQYTVSTPEVWTSHLCTALGRKNLDNGVDCRSISSSHVRDLCCFAVVIFDIGTPVGNSIHTRTEDISGLGHLSRRASRVLGTYSGVLTPLPILFPFVHVVVVSILVTDTPTPSSEQSVRMSYKSGIVVIIVDTDETFLRRFRCSKDLGALYRRVHCLSNPGMNHTFSTSLARIITKSYRNGYLRSFRGNCPTDAVMDDATASAYADIPQGRASSLIDNICYDEMISFTLYEARPSSSSSRTWMLVE